MADMKSRNHNMMHGRASIVLPEPVAVLAAASIAGTKEGQGPYGNLFDVVSNEENDMFGAKCWEEAESNMQKQAISMVLQKAGLKPEQIRYLFCGDLLGQDMATAFGAISYQIPLIGLFGACSTCGEALALGAMQVAAGYADKVISMTSSHFASAEKEFRFPLAYGGQRPLSASWTVTGSGAFILGKGKGGVSITAVTIGKIVDYGVKDTFNMGCAMAPAAADVIAMHFSDCQTTAADFDAVITGDLGIIGSQALEELLKEKGYDISGKHIDCGAEIFGRESQDRAGMDTHAGGSGCGCAAIMLASVFLAKLQTKEWSRMLFVPTGALLNKTSFNEGNTVPGIAHAVVIENLE